MRVEAHCRAVIPMQALSCPELPIYANHPSLGLVNLAHKHTIALQIKVLAF